MLQPHPLLGSRHREHRLLERVASAPGDRQHDHPGFTVVTFLGHPAGGIRMDGDPRIHLLGYGPSASTIGANRAARAAVRDIRHFLDTRAAA